jgi:uncharacterized delta-60 repeat protein
LRCEPLEDRTTPAALDPTFSGDGIQTVQVNTWNAYPHDVALQADGKLVMVNGAMVGNPYSGGGVQDFGVIRLNTDGSRDATFGNNGLVLIDIPTFGVYACAHALTLQPDGKILLLADPHGSQGDKDVVVRLNTNGTMDTTFGGDEDANGVRDGYVRMPTDHIGIDPFYYDQLRAIGVQPDGGIVVAGFAHWAPHAYNAYPNGQGHTGMVAFRLSPDGVFDSGFGNYGGAFFDGPPPWVYEQYPDYSEANALAIRPDGSIVLGGYYGPKPALGLTSDFALILLTPGGQPVADYRIPMDNVEYQPNDVITDVIALPTGEVIAAGHTAPDPTTDLAVLKFTPSFGLDPAFGSGGISLLDVAPGPGAAWVGGIDTQADGRIVLGGTAQSDFMVARVNAAGGLDTSFDGDGVFFADIYGWGWADSAHGVAVQADGKIVAGGWAAEGTGSGTTDAAAIRIDPNATSPPPPSPPTPPPPPYPYPPPPPYPPPYPPPPPPYPPGGGGPAPFAPPAAGSQSAPAPADPPAAPAGSPGDAPPSTDGPAGGEEAGLRTELPVTVRPLDARSDPADEWFP